MEAAFRPLLLMFEIQEPANIKYFFLYKFTILNGNFERLLEYGEIQLNFIWPEIV